MATTNPDHLVAVAQYFQGVYEEELERPASDPGYSSERMTLAFSAWKAAERLLAEMAGVK